MAELKGQVTPSSLLFGRNWEDPEPDRAALEIQPGDTLFAVTSGGCNVLGFLLQDPAVILSVDINPCQTHLLELKATSIRNLDFEVFLGFMGVKPHPDRVAVYRSLREHLADEARTFWDSQSDLIAGGVIDAGRYERFVGIFRRLLTLIQGRRRMEGLFESADLAEQAEYFRSRWDTRRFRSLLGLFFNKHVLARRGLSADYFRFDDSGVSFGESFYRRTRYVMTELPTRENYFLSSYLLGRYHAPAAVPDYLKAENYEIIRSRLDRIQAHTEDAKVFLEKQSEGSIQRFALSNICEVMDLADTERTFQAVRHAATPGATGIFRNLMVPRTVPATLSAHIVQDEEKSRRLRSMDRSFVYGRVDALRINP